LQEHGFDLSEINFCSFSRESPTFIEASLKSIEDQAAMPFSAQVLIMTASDVAEQHPTTMSEMLSEFFIQPQREVSASCPATRPASPLALNTPRIPKAASVPSSRRGSFVSNKKKLPPVSAADVLLRRNSSATFSTAPRTLPERTICPVHSYGAADNSLSQRRAAPSATFGTAPSGRGLTPRDTPRKLPSLGEGTPFVGPEAADVNKRRGYHATFGSSKVDAPKQEACEVHAYASSNQPAEKHIFHATIGSAPRSSRPSSGAARPHAYASNMMKQPTAKHEFHATIGSASARSNRPGSGAMRPHAYTDATSGPLKHSFQATFGTESRFPAEVAHLGWPVRRQPLGLPMQPASVAAC